jgi:hypothetical protein
MQRSLPLCVLLMAFVFACGCRKKEDKPASGNCCSTSYTSDLSQPYDTTGVADVFVAQIVADSTATGSKDSVYFFATTGMRTDSTQIIANGRELVRSLTVFKSAAQVYSADTTTNAYPVAWILSGNGNLNFSYTSTDTFPACSISIPDTIVNGLNNVFYFSTDVIAHADTVEVTIATALVQDSVTKLKYYATAPIGKVTIPDDIILAIKDQSVRVTVSACSHRYVVINGYKRLFVKQYTTTNLAWFR